MVKIEKDQLIITITTPEPEVLLHDFLHDIVICLQAGLTENDPADDRLPDSLHFLLELYKALLPDEEQIRKMFS